jgi:hypothetical protein
MMVWLHLKCQKDHLRHQLCVQSTCHEDEGSDERSAKSNELTAIQLTVMRIVHLKPFRTPKIGFSGTGTWII